MQTENKNNNINFNQNNIIFNVILKVFKMLCSEDKN